MFICTILLCRRTKVSMLRILLLHSTCIIPGPGSCCQRCASFECHQVVLLVGGTTLKTRWFFQSNVEKYCSSTSLSVDTQDHPFLKVPLSFDSCCSLREQLCKASSSAWLTHQPLKLLPPLLINHQPNLLASPTCTENTGLIEYLVRQSTNSYCSATPLC